MLYRDVFYLLCQCRAGSGRGMAEGALQMRYPREMIKPDGDVFYKLPKGDAEGMED